MGAKLDKFYKIDAFIEEARKKHGFKFDYSKVVLNGANSRIVITCPEHGDFTQLAHGHLKYGCYECNPRKKKNTDSFIKEAVNFHGDKYDYSLVDYNGSNKKVKIICKEHGVFEQAPSNHLEYGCVRCGYDKKLLSNEEFIEKCIDVHGDRYDYSLVEYKGAFEYVSIICKKHGVFQQEARIHQSGHNCQECSRETISENKTKSSEEFIFNAKMLHGDLYDYSKVDYKHSGTEVEILCEIHGAFKQKPRDHLGGSGCHSCGIEASRLNSLKDIEYFVQKAKETHGDKYDYSKSVYLGAAKQIEIVCKHHGSFWQRATDHYVSGCDKCGSIDTYSKTNYVNNAVVNHKGFANLYFIEVFDDVERFYKIGISVYDVEDRFSSFIQLPYNFHNLGIFKMSAEDAWDLETHLHKLLGKKLYRPLCNFGGSYKECFKLSKSDELKVISEIQCWLNKIDDEFV